MSDDNIIKFRKQPDPKKQQKPGAHKSGNGQAGNGKMPHSPPPKGGAMRVSPFVLLFFAAAAIGAVMYVLDQQKPAANTVHEAAP